MIADARPPDHAVPYCRSSRQRGGLVLRATLARQLSNFLQHGVVPRTERADLFSP
jgi:hypothetical protein